MRDPAQPSEGGRCGGVERPSQCPRAHVYLSSDRLCLSTVTDGADRQAIDRGRSRVEEGGERRLVASRRQDQQSSKLGRAGAVRPQMCPTRSSSFSAQAPPVFSTPAQTRAKCRVHSHLHKVSRDSSTNPINAPLLTSCISSPTKLTIPCTRNQFIGSTQQDPDRRGGADPGPGS